MTRTPVHDGEWCRPVVAIAIPSVSKKPMTKIAAVSVTVNWRKTGVLMRNAKPAALSRRQCCADGAGFSSSTLMRAQQATPTAKVAASMSATTLPPYRASNPTPSAGVIRRWPCVRACESPFAEPSCSLGTSCGSSAAVAEPESVPDTP